MKLNSMDLIEIFSGELFFAEKDNIAMPVLLKAVMSSKKKEKD